MKKGRHRRFEEARAMKRSNDINIEDIFESLQAERSGGPQTGEHPEWDDVDDEAESLEDEY